MLYDYNVGQLVGAMALMFMTFLVLVAAWKNRMPNLMLPWLVVQIVSIIIAISYLIYSAITGTTADDTGVVEILFACVGGGMYMSAHCAGGFMLRLSLGYFFFCLDFHSAGVLLLAGGAQLLSRTEG
jgi:hypothetical protein